MTPLYPPKSWDSRWRPEYGRECRFSGSTIKMLDLGDDHPVRKLLHAAWCAAIPWHLWIGVSTIPRAKNLLCRSVSYINHHYEPGPWIHLYDPQHQNFSFSRGAPWDEIRDWKTPSSGRLGKILHLEKEKSKLYLCWDFKSHFVFVPHLQHIMKKSKSGGWPNHYLVWWYGVNGFCFPMLFSSWMLWWDWHFGDLPWNEDYYCSWPFSTLH